MNKSTTIYVAALIVAFGTVSQAKYSGGTGEPNDPYQIATAADLITLGETPEDYDKHFILTADIDLDPNLPGGKVFDKAIIASDTDLGQPWERDTFDGTPFSGSFDGNDHTISNLTIEGGSYLGLFGSLAHGGEIKDLVVENVNLASSGYGVVGGLVGYNQGNLTHCHSSGALNRGNWEVGGLVGRNGGRIMRCSANGMVSGFTEVGGLVGANSFLHQDTGDFGYIAHSFSSAAVSGNGDRVGGLVGDNGGDVVQCYSAGSADGQYNVGGLIGLNQGGGVFISQNGVTQCYSTGAVSGRGSVGGLVGSSWGGSVTACFWDTQTSGQATSDGGTGETTGRMQDPNTFMAAGWDFYPHNIWVAPEGGGYPILWWQQSPLPELPSFSGGTGEPNTPYLIATPSDLQHIGHNPRLMAAHFTCVNDINLAGVSYVPIGGVDLPFTGVFDGNGKRILNFTYTSGDQDCIGFFGKVSGGAAVIRNVQLVYPNVDAGTGSDVGLLVGVLGDAEITGCSVQNGRLSGHDYTGALAGSSSGRVTNCYSTGYVSGRNSVGGLIGKAFSGAVTYCYSAGPVVGRDNVGGLLGENHLTAVTACFWDTETSGLVGSYGGTGKTTAEIQTASTFLEAGWDFVGESINGTEDIWSICEGTNYPRLTSQIPAADFVCPDGITTEDFMFLIEHWGDNNCDPSNDYCQATDLDFSGTVDAADLEILLENWLQSPSTAPLPQVEPPEPNAPPKGRACFPADTPVWVNGILVQISNVVPGQMVGEFRCDVATDCLEQIETVEEHEGTFECRDIVLESGHHISVVDAHCFMLDSGQWIAAQDLRHGLRLKTLNAVVSIKSVAIRARPFVGKVYNLKVAGVDWYSVGEDGVIVRDY